MLYHAKVFFPDHSRAAAIGTNAEWSTALDVGVTAHADVWQRSRVVPWWRLDKTGCSTILTKRGCLGTKHVFKKSIYIRLAI